MEEILSGMDGVLCFMDNVLLHSEDQQKHEELKAKVLQRLQEVGLKLNRAKCQFDEDEVEFLGHIISGDGIQPDQSKIKAIADMPDPKNITDLRRLLGMINYLGRYIPNLSSTIKPLNDLLGKDVQWAWTSTVCSFRRGEETPAICPNVYLLRPEKANDRQC